jgi:type IV pilus assembly protein PilP
MTTRLASILLFAVLGMAGCGSDEFDDLRKFMDEAGKQNVPKLEPLPSVVPPATFEYQQGDLQDPFKQRTLRPEAGKDGFIPDLNKRTGPFVEYPLDALRMVGLMSKNKRVNAVIRLPDGRLLLAKVGDPIGQNFGIISAINENGMEIKEITLDSTGNWAQSKAILSVQDTTAPVRAPSK